MNKDIRTFIIAMGFLALAFCLVIIYSIRKEKEFKANSATTEVVSLPEKVVILGKVSNQFRYYKVKRINEGVVTFIRIKGASGGYYSIGDTIYWKF